MEIPLINGINYSWANIRFVLFGVPVVGITEINWTKKQKKENNYGMGTKVVSRGYGNEEPEADFTIYREELNKLIAAAPNRDILKIPPFQIQVVFVNLTGQTVTTVIKGCEFTESGLKAAQGDTSFKCKLPLIVADIIE